MSIEDLKTLLLTLLHARHTHEDPEEQKACDEALVMSCIMIMLTDSAAALEALAVEKRTDAMLRSVAHNPNAPKA